jgi:hypothetical protein
MLSRLKINPKHKRPCTIAALTMLGAAMITPGSDAFAQESFPMVCRGGGGMRAEVFANGEMRILFTPAAQAANVAPPRPGECIWLDRTFRPGEPAMLLSTFGAARVLLDPMVQGSPFDVHVFNNNQGAMQVTRVGP